MEQAVRLVDPYETRFEAEVGRVWWPQVCRAARWKLDDSAVGVSRDRAATTRILLQLLHSLPFPFHTAPK